jgi:hypothetical protein
MRPAATLHARLARARVQRQEVAAAREHLELRRRRAELVDRDVVERRVAWWAGRLRAAWEGWPAREAAGMAARLGVDEGALVLELEQRVAAFLRELADERCPFPRSAS